jgi:hypothetical protein
VVDVDLLLQMSEVGFTLWYESSHADRPATGEISGGNRSATGYAARRS